MSAQNNGTNNGTEINELILCGYIREAHHILHVNTIPTVINGIISIYFTYFIPEFDQTKHGRNLIFPSNRVVKKYRHSTFCNCVFGTPVSNSVCNKFNIYVKILSMSHTNGFMMGYVRSKQCIKDWNQRLGIFDNKYSSTGIQVMVGKKDQNLYLYNSLHEHGSLRYKAKFSIGHILILSFDFKDDCLQIYHNNIPACKICLQTKLNKQQRILPAFSFYEQDDSIEIVKCELLR
eukprot:72626_1